MSPSPSNSKILLLAPLSLGKTLKTALEQQGILDREEKISRVDTGGGVGGDEKADITGAGADRERRGGAEKRISGTKDERGEGGGGGRGKGEGGGRLCIPTTIMVDSTTGALDQTPFSSISHQHNQTQPPHDPHLIKQNLLDKIGMLDRADEITLVLRPFLPTTTTTNNPTSKTPKLRPQNNISGSTSLLARVINEWSLSLPATISSPVSTVSKDRSYSYSYTIYPPMLLLPTRTFVYVADLLVASGGADRVDGEGSEKERVMMMTEKRELMEKLYERLCEAFKVTHIALSGPIPAMMLEEQDSSSTSSRILLEKNTNSANVLSPSSPSSTPKPQEFPNILRAPLNSFTPLHGDFGPSLPAHHVPTCDDFAKAFWCTVRQNGIFQTWAPRYTMFSRGNLSEKTRLLGLLDTLPRAIENNAEESDLVGLVGRDGIKKEEKESKERGRREREMISAVDLYAGVGYFAFCYAAKEEVVSKVFCWEISRWSVEGLRRGAVGNGWGVRVFEEGEQDDDDRNGTEKEERLIVYRESNQHANARIAAMRSRMPPVRHVNCGFLPSSKESWETAVQVLDSIQGGWIHAHENIAIRDFECRRMEIVQDFRNLVERHHHHGKEDEGDEQQQWQVECVHFEQVKTYAPGVVHCVLDISVSQLSRLPTDTAPQLNASTPSVQR